MTNAEIAMSTALATRAARMLGGRSVASRLLSGGDIGTVVLVTLDDGTAVVAKQGPSPASAEADGLAALRAAGAAVPDVLAVDGTVLVLQHVSGTPDWAAWGRMLAAVHATTGDTFGWPQPNVIGSLPQDNTPHGHWGTFFADRRVRPWLDAPALPWPVRDRLIRALDGPIQDLLGAHDPTPSLVHGDLWSGNVIDGRWLIDPAVHHADRELDLAMMDLFGGFPAAAWDAYLRQAPLPEGWEERRACLQLHYLLVHVKLFGGGYVGGVQARLDRLGW